MTPSPDDILAAQLWPWPDPALKRDVHGRVLFVNHAFLKLFGGQIEQWRGQTIEGWHTPTPGAAINRFEIRIPANGGQPEQVYDWVEQTDQRGFAIAMARNVTDLLDSAPPPPPGAEAAPAQHTPLADGQSAESQTQNSAVANTAEPEPIIAQSVPDHASPAHAQPDHTHQIASGQSMANPLDMVGSAPDPVSAAAVQHVPASSISPDPTPVDTPPKPIEDTPTETPAVSSDRSEAPRDFERRALPIEDGAAVLGNNWRDAVIAKALGAEDDEAAESSEGANLSAQASTADGSQTMPSSGNDGGSSGSGQSIRILLAEDNAINALLTRTLLEAEGHTVETVEDGQLAVEAMKTQSFDLIFMDMRMPNMDGLEATRNIRRLPNVPSELPIVALTANAFDDDRNACFDSGMNDFMTKPVSAEELSEMVTRWTAKGEEAPDQQRMAG